MSQGPSKSSEALARLRNTQPAAPVEPAKLPETTGDDTPVQRFAHQPTADAAKPVAPAEKLTWRDRLNSWLDSFRGPSQEDVERAIANTPERIQQRWQQLQDDRAAAAAAEAHTQQLVAEVAEARRALESQWEREADRMAELERDQALAARRRQQERETAALLQAARELESDDIPAPENRPMLQREGEYLSEEALLALARENLPEWQRLERIVNKARSIEAQTPPPRPGEGPGDDDGDDEVVLPFRKPITEDPDPEQLDGFRRITLTLSWVLFVVVGLFALGWLGPWPSVIDAHDGLYAGSTTYFSMASWHVIAWPLLWALMLGYTLYQWSPSQYSAVRNRATAWYVSNAMLLAAGTILLAHFQDVGLEAITAVATTALLYRAVQQLNTYTARTAKEQAFVDVPIGVFTGWMLIFSGTTIFTAMAAWQVLDFLWIPEIIWAIIVMLGLLAVLSSLTLTGRGRMSVAVGFTLGLTAIIGSRLFGQHPSFLLTGIALLGVFVILAATENRRYQIASAEKQALAHLVYLDELDDETA